MEKKVIEINADRKPLGRVASQAALSLRGKESPEYLPHKAPTQKVRIINAKAIAFTGEKKKQKEYIRFSGYPGGLYSETLERLIARRGIAEAVRRAVYGMLPNNRLRKIAMKNLEVLE